MDGLDTRPWTRSSGEAGSRHCCPSLAHPAARDEQSPGFPFKGKAGRAGAGLPVQFPEVAPPRPPADAVGSCSESQARGSDASTLRCVAGPAGTMSQDTEVDMKEVELNELEPEKQPMNAASGAAVSAVAAGGSEKNGLVKIKAADDDAEAAAVKFTGLSKEELLKVAGSPGWVRTRWALLLLFWLGWLGMLAGAVVIIVRAPRCRELPALRWWHKGALYRVGDLQAFQGCDAGGLEGERGGPPPPPPGTPEFSRPWARPPAPRSIHPLGPFSTPPRTPRPLPGTPRRLTFFEEPPPPTPCSARAVDSAPTLPPRSRSRPVSEAKRWAPYTSPPPSALGPGGEPGGARGTLTPAAPDRSSPFQV